MLNYSSTDIKKVNRKQYNQKINKLINKNQVFINIQNNFGLIQKNILENKYIILKFVSNNKSSNFSEKFELLNYINSGSSGVVFKGFDRKNPSHHLCFKFLMKDLRKNRKNKINNQNLKEIIIHNKLKNDNIINYYNYINLKNFGCIVMEYAELGDLEYFQKIVKVKRYFSESLLAFITVQILNGLFSLTKSKIIHMDIKPQNLLIDKNFNIKITDFSVSFSYEHYKKHQKVLLPFSGTSLYMSPEVLSNEYIDYIYCNKIDLYSLGVVLYYFAFEQFPYGLNISDQIKFNLILKKIKSSKLIFPNRKNIYSLKFLNFLSKLIEKDIKSRISIYEALNDPWVKGGELLFNEKEKIDDNEIFLLNIITDNIRSFNEYIYEK